MYGPEARLEFPMPMVHCTIDTCILLKHTSAVQFCSSINCNAGSVLTSYKTKGLRQIPIVAVSWLVDYNDVYDFPQAGADDMMACCGELQHAAVAVQQHNWVGA